MERKIGWNNEEQSYMIIFGLNLKLELHFGPGVFFGTPLVWEPMMIEGSYKNNEGRATKGTNLTSEKDFMGEV